MSNKIVPSIYRNVIDDVISSIKGDFDEYGVGEDVLAELQRKWENKVIASHVAEFEAPAPPVPAPYPPHPMHPALATHPHYPAYAPPPPPPPLPGPQIKAEPVEQRAIDSRYLLHPPGPHALPYPLPGPPRIPQVDGPSSRGSGSPPPPQYAPHSSHPSLPQPAQAQAPKTDDEAINSDLDDSDSEGEEDPEEGGPAESDIVFCTYDKVARVKNKWKCILKDGMIHVNGKDYLFAKCTGEFEW